MKLPEFDSHEEKAAFMINEFKVSHWSSSTHLNVLCRSSYVPEGGDMHGLDVLTLIEAKQQGDAILVHITLFPVLKCVKYCRPRHLLASH